MKMRFFKSCVGCLLLSVLFLGNAYSQKAKLATVQIGGQSENASYGGFVDVSNGIVYQIDEATQNQSDIDLVYAYGKTTKINLMTPSSTGLKYFGNRYKANVFDKWETKNRGSIMVLPNNKETRKLYKSVKSNEDLAKAYAESIQGIATQKDYKKEKHGPSARVMNLEIGDFILFKSRQKDLYAIGRVVDNESGTSGSITIDFKVTSK